MNLLKTSVLTGLATVLRVITAFIINKVIANLVGPSGLAVVGQLQNFIEIIVTASNGAVTNGVVKYTSEYDNIEQKQRIFSTAITLSLICSSVIAIALIMGRNTLSMWVLHSPDYGNVFAVFGLTVFLFALNAIFLAILNGQKEIKKYVAVNMLGSIISLVVTTVLIFQFKLLGALYALVLNQSVLFFATLLFVVKSPWFKPHYFLQGIDRPSLIKLGHFSLMALTTALTVPLSHLFIRNYIAQELGWQNAGYWQGIWYISSMYLMVVTTSLSIYYLPKLSSMTEKADIRKEIWHGYRIIVPLVVVMAVMIYVLRDWVIWIAFSNDFKPMLPLFAWQLIGDVIKIISWVLAFLMISKAMTKAFVVTEIFFSILFITLSVVFIHYFGLVGVTYAFATNYTLYLIMMLMLFKEYWL